MNFHYQTIPKQTYSPRVVHPCMRFKRRVSFKPTATVRTYHSCHANGMTKEEKSKLYYSRQELKVFNLEAQAICILSQELPAIQNSGTFLTLARESTGGVANDDDATDSLRGLELMMFPKRRHNKLLAQRAFLKYQTRLNSRPGITSERRHRALAAASAKLSLWSSLIALETARLDAVRAFDGDYMIHQINIPKPVAMISPFPYYKKRLRRDSRRITEDATDGTSPKRKRRQLVNSGTRPFTSAAA